MRACLRFVRAYFASKHYVCRRCRLASAYPDDLCEPIEEEFEP